MAANLPGDSPKLVDKKLLYRGFVYLRSRVPEANKTYWECKRLKSKTCKARAVTVGEGSNLVVTRCGDHEHPPDREECEAEKVMNRLKRKAEDEVALPPALILRDGLRNVPNGVIARLPERRNIKKALRRARRAELPANPTQIENLGRLPDRFRVSLQGDRFLMSDNEEATKRVLVFGTRRNLEKLAKSSRWYMDGTFKVSCKNCYIWHFINLTTLRRHRLQYSRKFLPYWERSSGICLPSTSEKFMPCRSFMPF